MEINSFDEKELKKFMKWVIEGNRIGKKKYPPDNFVKDNMFEFMLSELRDTVNYLFFLYLKIKLLEKGIIKELKEVNGVKKLR